MSDESLFSKHLRLIETDESQWTEDERLEFQSLQQLDLPPLVLPPAPAGRLEQLGNWWRQPKFYSGLAIAGVASLTVFSLLVSRQMGDVEDRLSAKGSLQVSVFWERDGKVSPLMGEMNLKDGDKVGAAVLTSEDSVAYWAITDRDFKTLSDASDVESSKISLQAGVRKTFDSSFELVAPNQGENLVIVVCPRSAGQSLKTDTAPLFDQTFVAKLISESRIRSSQCVFVGSRLRGAP